MCEKINSYTWLRIFVFLSVLGIGSIAGAKMVYVNDSAAGNNDGSSRIKEHVLTAGTKQFRFVQQPELGYIVKTRKETTGITNLVSTLTQLQPSDQNLLGIVGRPQTMIVRSHLPFSEQSHAIEMLSTQPQIEYIAPLFSSDGRPVAVIPEIVVCLRNRLDADELSNLWAETNCTIIKRLELAEPIYYLVAPEAQDANDVFVALRKLNEVGSIKWAMPNIAFQPELCGQIIPNDKYFTNQWYLHNTGQSGGTPNADINAPEAWEITTGDPNIVVAVLDSGVETKHPDLINNLVRGYDFCDNDDSPDPIFGENADNAHGTACAGLIAAQANNNIGVAGIAPTCKVMPIRIFWINKADEAEWITDATVAEAIVWAAENGADVISISWGGSLARTVLQDAIISVTKLNGIGRNGKGCCILAASGNNSGDKIDYPIVFPTTVLYPAAFPEVIAVGATDYNDQRLYYSNYGSGLEIVAPSGCNSEYTSITKFWTTDMIGEEGYNDSNYPHLVSDYTDNFGGTSAACPLAAGVAALILSIDSDLTNNEVRGILLRSALDLGPEGWDEEYGFGRIDAYAAVTMALGPKRISTLFVDDDAVNDPGPEDPNISDPLEDGSIEHPFDAIQEAIDYAVAGNTILIRAGTYMGNGKKGIDFRSRTIEVRSEDGPEHCIIDCRHSGRGFFFDNNEGPDSVLEGLTITNGYSGDGGGIYCGSRSNPTIINCVLRGNLAAESGGGCYISSSSTLINCTFIDNSANSGGGLYIDGGNSTLINCTFRQNSAENGGGLYSDWENPKLKNCTFIANSAGESGGGIYNYHNSPTLINCTFSANSAEYGGATYNRYSRAISLINCTFAQNSTQSGDALACDSSETQLPSSIKLTNCIIWDGDNGVWNSDGSSIDITYSNIQNSQAGIYDPQEAVIWGEGNINVDPLFADLGYWADVNEPKISVEPNDPNAVWIDGDYHLKSHAGRWDPLNKSWLQDDVTSPKTSELF